MSSSGASTVQRLCIKLYMTISQMYICLHSGYLNKHSLLAFQLFETKRSVVVSKIMLCAMNYGFFNLSQTVSVAMETWIPGFKCRKHGRKNSVIHCKEHCILIMYSNF